MEQTNDLDGKLSVFFFGFLRISEIMVPSDATSNPSNCLCVTDLVDCRNHPFLLKVDIKKSKMDTFRKGVSIFLSHTNMDICPVAAVTRVAGYHKRNT